MGDDSPLPSPSRRKSHNLEAPSRSSLSPRHLASGVKTKSAGGMQDSNGEGNGGGEGRRHGGSLARGR